MNQDFKKTEFESKKELSTFDKDLCLKKE